MTLQASGTISVSNINVELGRTSTAASNLNESTLRTLANVPSGSISLSNFYGKTYGDPSGTGKYPTSGFSNTSRGTITWVNQTNATGAANSVYSTSTGGGNPPFVSNYLVLQNLGFNIPTNKTIAGITAYVTGYKNVSTSVPSAKLWNGSSTTVDQSIGTAKSITFTVGTSTTFTLGGSTDVWGASLTPAIINSSNFGIALMADKTVTGSGGTHVCYIDSVQILVYYS